MTTTRINNLTIRHNRYNKKWEVVTPDKLVWEEFAFEKDAILFAEDTHDFLTPVGYYRKYGRRKPVKSQDGRLY